MSEQEKRLDEQLERRVAERLYAIAGVEEVRREDIPEGVVFWVRGNNLSEEAFDAIIELRVNLIHLFPNQYIHLEITDRFSCPPLYSSSWDKLAKVAREKGVP